MNKILFLALALLTGTAQAEAPNICPELEYLAGAVMFSRQSGVPMQRVMEIIVDQEADELLAEAAKEMVIDAYETPKYSVKKNQKNAQVEFQNKIYRQCLIAQ